MSIQEWQEIKFGKNEVEGLESSQRQEKDG